MMHYFINICTGSSGGGSGEKRVIIGGGYVDRRETPRLIEKWKIPRPSRAGEMRLFFFYFISFFILFYSLHSLEENHEANGYLAAAERSDPIYGAV